MAGDRMLFQRGDDFRNLSNWDIVVLGMPLKIRSEAKEPYKNDWPDEHGDEEWDGSLFMQAFELEITFGVKAIWVNTTLPELKGFIDWLDNGEFMFWSEYGNFGRQHVRYAGYDEDATLWKGKKRTTLDRAPSDFNEWILRFKLKFKVNDPVTDVYHNQTYTGLYTA